MLWSGLVLTVLLVVVWGASERWHVIMYNHPWMVGTRAGGIDIARDSVTMYRMPPGWYATRRTDGVPRMWRPTLEVGANRLHTEVPFWLPAIFTLSASLGAWRLETLARRRERAGACPRCRYSRAGLPAISPCPECGAAPTAD